MRFLFTRLFPALALLALSAALPLAAGAAETRTVGDTITLEVGFVTEPPIQGDTNGLRVRVLNGETPVEGAEGTLSAQVFYAGQPRELPLAPVPGEPGVYSSVFIPTQPGQYTFALAGAVEGVEINETFEPSEGGVPLVAARLEFEFPSPANGAVSNLAFPAAAGAVILLAGAAVYVMRRREA
jgi:hypothetical protein